MKNKYTQKQKQKILERYRCGERIAEISSSTGIPKTTIYAWIRSFNVIDTSHNRIINLKMYRELERKYTRQKKIITIFHESPIIACTSLDERIGIIDEMISDEYTVNTLCEALCVAKGTYYNRKLRGKQGYTEAMKKRDAIKPVIKGIYDESNQIYGPGKVHAILKDRGYACSINVVASIMHQNNWFSVRTGAKALYEQSLLRKENIVKQQFKVSAPNEVWVSDVTEMRYNNKKLYLCVIIDLFARKVVSYRYSDKNNTPLTKKTFDAAYKSRQPDSGLIFHTDQGSNYTSRTFRMFLKERNVKIIYICIS